MRSIRSRALFTKRVNKSGKGLTARPKGNDVFRVIARADPDSVAWGILANLFRRVPALDPAFFDPIHVAEYRSSLHRSPKYLFISAKHS
jgi:hypothetical protein